jgi:hypothetical protein
MDRSMTRPKALQYIAYSFGRKLPDSMQAWVRNDLTCHQTSPTACSCGNRREALEVPKERHRDTFDECGNLFAAGIPVNLDRAITDGQLKKG